jgi:serine/threonine-protein kinase
MASVYLGRSIDDERGEQLVALKVIKDELANDENFISMFLDEAKILSKLSHPNIIRTLEFGVSGEHRFIAMELLLGRSLMDVWEVCFAVREKISLGLVAWIAARVCEGLHYAHELEIDGEPLQVIHRDVNPSNIFLTYDGDVKLIDFGLAKAVGRHSRSAEGVVKGKIPYLAPEQIKQKPIDRRADVYALGITLWECAAMRRLFKRDNDVDTLRAIQNGEVPDLRKEASCPEELWSIISKALAEDLDARYATAAALGADLDGFVKKRGSEDHRRELDELLARLFQGERPRQQAWLEEARDRPRPNQTMPPPAPLPSVPPEALEEELKEAAKAAEGGSSRDLAKQVESSEKPDADDEEDDEREESPNTKRSGSIPAAGARASERPERDEAEKKPAPAAAKEASDGPNGGLALTFVLAVVAIALVALALNAMR